MFLIDRADPGAFRQLDVAPLRDEFALDQLEQGGFANAVAPDQAHLGASGNRDVRPIK